MSITELYTGMPGKSGAESVLPIDAFAINHFEVAAQAPFMPCQEYSSAGRRGQTPLEPQPRPLTAQELEARMNGLKRFGLADSY